MKRESIPIYFRRIIVIALLLVIPMSYAISEYHLRYQRRNQMRNMAEMRAVGSAVEAYAVDHNAYPPGNSTVSALKRYLEPAYIKKIPRKDSWGNHFLYNASEDLQSYTITSYGRDHTRDLPKNFKGVITRFTNDITFSNGSFMAFPEGI